MSRRLFAGLIVLFLLQSATPVWANSVETLPEGIFALGFKFGFKTAWKRFGNSFSSDTVDITNDYHITLKGQDLDVNRFKPEDVIGTLDVDYDNYGMEFNITTAFGITDSLTAMIIIPVGFAHSSFKFNLYNSNLHMVRNAMGTPVMIAPERDKALWASQPGMTVSEDVLDADEFHDVLTCRDNASELCQFQYKPLRDWNRWGVGEIIGGMRFKFWETDKLRQGITVFGKFPTGYHRNTDDLFDTNYGDQQVDLGFWYGIDYTPIKELMFNVSLGYTEQLPEIKENRIFVSAYDELGIQTGVLPLGPYWQKMKVHRDIGGNWDLYFGMSWSILEYLSYSNEFYFFWKYLDNYWAAEQVPLGPNGETWEPDFRSLEWGTDQAALELTNSIGFTTLPWVMRGEFPVPLMLSAGYSVGLAGQNFEQNHTGWISLDLVGSIYMFDMGEKEKEEDQLDDFKLPGRAEGEDGSDPDGSLAQEYDKRDSNYYLDPARNFHFRQSFGNVRKYDW